MDLRDLIKKMDSIENPETGQKKRIDEEEHKKMQNEMK